MLASRQSGWDVKVRGWGVLVPVAFALAGVLFATSAEVSHGTDLRIGRRHQPAGPDPGPAARRSPIATARVDALRRSVDALTTPQTAGDRQVQALDRASAALALAAGTAGRCAARP